MTRVCLALCLFSSAACTGPPDVCSAKAAVPAESRSTAAEPRRRAAPVAAVFQNVHLRIAPGVTLEMRRVEGALVPARNGEPPTFDDNDSFLLRVDAGEVAMTPASLTKLLNDYVFAYEGSPLEGIEVSIEDGRLKQKGTLKKGVSIPFSITADLSVTGAGHIRLHPAKISAAGIPSGRLMDLFGLELEDLIASNRAQGFRLENDDFLLDPERLLPSPAIRGKVTSVRVEKDRIVQVFGSRRARVARQAGNFMSYRGGVLRFGKLTMTDADMRLIDADPADPFDFSPPEYLKHLVAGYSKTTPGGGLRVYMPDYDEAAGADLRPPRRTTKP
jgi:hypothetical protein